MTTSKATTNQSTRTAIRWALLALAVALLALVAGPADHAGAAGQASSQLDTSNGFPIWYQDSAGNRVEQCLDPGDANCIVLAGPTFNPLNPTVFPTNFPDEFFYAIADSEIVDTPGCAGTLPGKASVRVALEGAFVNGDPAPGEQMVFGRVRVRVSSGLCPNTTYRFQHPFGVEELTTNAAGAIPANVGTEDIGCAPLPPARCDFDLARTSRVFGDAAGGFLRWDPASAPAAPAGYLGDSVTPHTIVGATGTNPNAFRILDGGGRDLGMSTDLFTVAGKLAGSLTGNPTTLDFGGQDLGTTSAVKTVTVTNVDSASVTIGAIDLAGADAGSFAVPAASNTCAGRTLARDATCTVGLTFSPTGLAGRRNATLTVASTGGVRSPLSVRVTGNATNVGDAPAVSLNTTAIDFGGVRVRTSSPDRTIRVTNTGAAPLGVTLVELVNSGVGSGAANFRLSTDTCSAGGLFIDPGESCTVDVAFAPFVAGPHSATIRIHSNAAGSPHEVTLTGNGTGGVAAVSPDINPDTGFPEWYMDEAGVKLDECIDPADPYCVVLGDDFFDPAQPLRFPTNFPSEYFYQVATSDNIETPGCNGTSPGRAFLRTAMESAFVNAGPAVGEQMVFGRVRLVVTGGLCPNTEYVFTHPYGVEHVTTNAAGAVPRNAATEDIGCFPVAPETCDFSAALASRIAGGYLRWDPSVAPAAPAGYIGDPNLLHKIVGAPYSPDGVTPANYLEIATTDGTVVGRTDQFSIMGKLRGPLEATRTTVDFGVIPVGSTSQTEHVAFTNTGIAPITVDGATIGGTDAGDFDAQGGSCLPTAALAPGASCEIWLRFSPAAVGVRTATLAVTHSGLNNPVTIRLTGVGGAADGQAAISFSLRSMTFASLHVGRVSPVQTLSISNAGGNTPLDVRTVTLGGTGAASFSIVANRCADPVDPGAACQVDVAFSPTVAGPITATIVVTDNAPGGTHTVVLNGTGSNAAPAVSAGADSRNGFPQWYQDSNGVRLEQCLDPADPNCIVLPDAGFDPANPVSFPTNFPSEFFYALADSDLIATDGCGGTTTPGHAFLRVAMEASFAGGTPLDGDQTTFGRVRVVVTSGLCANAPYVFLTPYGPYQFTTNGVGGFGRNAGTQDIGCGAAPCNFADALDAPVADSFLRWDPASGAPAPVGYLGDAVTLHKVVGGTHLLPDGTPVNFFSINDLAGNEIGRTDLFMVSGKIAGPFQANPAAVDFGHQSATITSGARTVTLTNVTDANLAIASIAITGANQGDFAIAAGGTCAGAAVAPDATCTVRVTFTPSTTGTRNATLSITPTTGRATLVPLTGIGDPAPAPIATVTPGILAYGTVTAGSSASLTTTVSNTGNANLVVGAPTLSGAAAADFSVTGNTCATVIPGGSCQITVRFGPAAIGSRTASLTIPHNATGGSTTVSLTATGQASTFVLSPNPVKFGGISINTTKTTTVTVRNSGTLAFRVTRVAISGAQAAAFSVVTNGCANVTLAAGRTCNITVGFRPTSRIDFAADLVVDGDATSLPRSVSTRLTGTGK